MSEITLNAEKLERAIKAAGFRLKLGVKQYELVPLLPRLTKPTADDHPAACTNCGDPLPTTVSCAYCGHPHRVAADDQARRDAERLDWLETAQQTVYRYEEQVRLPKTDGSNEYEIRLEFRGWCVTGNDGEYFDTPRDAIDAAQAASAAEDQSIAMKPLSDKAKQEALDAIHDSMAVRIADQGASAVEGEQ